jgi:hypothetical protein
MLSGRFSVAFAPFKSPRKTIYPQDRLAGLCAAASGFPSPRYQLVQALAASIDALAEDLKSDSDLFAAKPHGR